MSRFLVATTGHAAPLAGGETCVGTDPAVQIPVRGDMGLMPRHFVIAPRQGGWQVAAFEGATVLVNGLQVQQAAIHDGDQIVAGQLVLTYRDEQEAVRRLARPTSTHAPGALPGMPASLSQNSFPSLHQGLPRLGADAMPTGLTQFHALPAPLPLASPPPIPEELARPPLRRPPEPRDDGSLGGRKLSADVGTGTAAKRSGGVGLIFFGLVIIAVGGMLIKKASDDKEVAEKAKAEKAAKAVPEKPLTAADIIVLEGRVAGGGMKPQEPGDVSAREDERITCLYGGYFAKGPGGRDNLRDLGRMDLPDDLPFDAAWTKRDNVAKFGFLKEECILPNDSGRLSGVVTYTPGPKNWRKLITLEVDGVVYRSLATARAKEKEKDEKSFYLPMIYGGGSLLAVGLLVMLMGWENCKK